MNKSKTKNFTDKIKIELEDKVMQYIEGAKLVNKGHVGGTLSICHVLLYLLYFLNVKKDNPIILSKGHASLGVYITQVISKKIKIADLQKKFEADNSPYEMIAAHNFSKDVIAFGNLGNGASYAVGRAIAKRDSNIYCIVGDGEINEGICWEAFMSASKYKLANLFMIIDNNKFSHDGNLENIMPLGSLKNKMESFGFEVKKINAHNFLEINNAFASFTESEKPKCIILDSIKGFGLKELEGTIEVHSL